MDNEGTRDGSVRYCTTPGWWAPALLDVLALPALVRSGSTPWWAIDVAAVVLVLVVLYVVTHPTLHYSSRSFTLSRGPFQTSVDLGDLASVRIMDLVRRTNVLDPQTGERRSNVRWFIKSPDDWGGVTPVQGYVIKDMEGHRVSINAVRAGAPWAPLLLAALREHPDVELGPRVVPSLNDFAR
ncbi:MAG: hypothetical protein KGJ47_03770 [Acidobacteriota bacterium]|nr:hypothetical protein [Acidobacteriota bacterium]